MWSDRNDVVCTSSSTPDRLPIAKAWLFLKIEWLLDTCPAPFLFHFQHTNFSQLSHTPINNLLMLEQQLLGFQPRVSYYRIGILILHNVIFDFS
jgi:hypothetical protein